MPDGSTVPVRLLRLPEVKEKVAMGSSTIYRRIAAGTFPVPVQLSENAVAWHESEIDAWILARPRIRAVTAAEG